MNDLISRQALCEYALNQKDKSVTPNDIMRFPSAQVVDISTYSIEAIAEAVAKKLVADVPDTNVRIDAVKHGRWVPGREIGKDILIGGTTEVVYEDYKCSSCGLMLFRLLYNIDGTPFYKFCPNCGARMDGE